MNIPAREKYVEERIGRWFIFGEYPDGRVDISDGQKDVFVCMNKGIAFQLCELQHEFYSKVTDLLCGNAPVRGTMVEDSRDDY